MGHCACHMPLEKDKGGSAWEDAEAKEWEMEMLLLQVRMPKARGTDSQAQSWVAQSFQGL